MRGRAPDVGVEHRLRFRDRHLLDRPADADPRVVHEDVDLAGGGGPVEQVPIAEAQAMFDTNVWGAARMVQAVAPGMRERSRDGS